VEFSENFAQCKHELLRFSFLIPLHSATIPLLFAKCGLFNTKRKLATESSPFHRLTMFEHRRQPLLAPGAFYRRLARSAGLALAIVFLSLGIGMAGYHFLEDLPWLDAFENAAMILSGMGPVAPVQTNAGKLFAGSYALFSGLAFITSIGVVLAPVCHRFLHKFHLEAGSDPERKKGS
jgi:hypothetical protein